MSLCARRIPKAVGKISANPPVRHGFSQCARVPRCITGLNTPLGCNNSTSRPWIIFASGKPMASITQTRYASNDAEPQWTPPDASSRSVAVLGGGARGRRIACSWLAAGYKVILCETNGNRRDASTLYIENNLESYAGISGKQGDIKNFATVLRIEEAVEDAWLVVEAQPEMVPFKIGIMAHVDQKAPKDCILACASSPYKTRPILDQMDAGSRHRVCHVLYNKPPGKNLVKLVAYGETHADVLSFLQTKLQDAGMHPSIVDQDSTSFLSEEPEERPEDIKLPKATTPVNIYEKTTSGGFELIGRFVSHRKAGQFLGLGKGTILKLLHSGQIYNDRYKFSHRYQPSS